MLHDEVDFVIIGGGPAGLGISYLLSTHGCAHVVVERGQVGESWRSRRWDSFRLAGANWSLQFPGYTYAGDDPCGFMPRDEVVAAIEAYARSFSPPVHEGVRATAVKRRAADGGFRIETTAGTYDAQHVVVATGRNRFPLIPSSSAQLPPDIMQVTADAYRNPSMLPAGATLVVGSGQSGCQIAEELAHGGRDVYLSVGSGWWFPAWYRGHDSFWWFVELGGFDAPAHKESIGHSPLVTGQDGGRTINLHTIARHGIRLVGHLAGVDGGRLIFRDNVDEIVAKADASANRFLQQVDDLIERIGSELPSDKSVRDPIFWSHPATSPRTTLELRDAGVNSVIWASGYRLDFSWIDVPAFDQDGYPLHVAGVAAYDGLYFPVLPGRDTLLGELRDSTHIAETILGRVD